ncbi:SAM-dependent methyltransferase [Kitasatospora sp. NPDC087314]|uniref:SAM-dependent methyltransferase n=1 Tax=Kitasatospora sp. NPDC087314 TaxID=3364068 RepID=UPI00381A652C
MPDANATDPVAEFYDQLTDLVAAAYDGNLHLGYSPDPDDPSTLEAAPDLMTDELIQRLSAGPGHRVLDVGCGTGKPALRLARTSGASVVGISVSRHQVNVANANAQAQQLHEQASFEYADAAQLPFADASFDAAWAFESMLHISDHHQVLSELKRVLHPGGRLVIADFALRGPVDVHDLPVVDAFRATSRVATLRQIDDYPALIETAGLRLLDITDISDHARPSFAKVVSDLNAARDQFSAHIGADTFDAFVGSVAAYGALPQAGYVVLTASKP